MGDGMFGKFKALIGVEDSEEEIEEVEPVPKYEEQVKTIERTSSFIQPRTAERKEPASNIVNMSIPTTKKQYKLYVVEPRTFEECLNLVDSLNSNKPIIINLERAEHEVAKKIFDFLSGATYAIGGQALKVANNIFVFAPQNVDVMASAPAKQTTQPKPSKETEKDGYVWKK